MILFVKDEKVSGALRRTSAMKLRKPFMEASSLNTNSACALTLDQTSSRSGLLHGGVFFLWTAGAVPGWGWASCFFQSNWIKSIGHHLPFCFFFFCLAWPGGGCWRSCCLDFSAFFSACSCRISCSCFFHRGLCSGSLWPVKPGEELCWARKARTDSFRRFPRPFSARSKICGGIPAGRGRY